MTNTEDFKHVWRPAQEGTVGELTILVGVRLLCVETDVPETNVRITVNNRWQIVSESSRDLATTCFLFSPFVMMPGFYVAIEKPPFGKLEWLTIELDEDLR